MAEIMKVVGLLVATCFFGATSSATYHPICDETPLNTFDINKMLTCGFNADAWSLWIPMEGSAFCERDSIDVSDKGDYVCYSVNSSDCTRSPYMFTTVPGETYMERDLGNGEKTKSLVLDTDNCKYLFQFECFPDGTVWRYLTYKSTWTDSEKQAFKEKVADHPYTQCLKPYTFKCAEGEL
ncbi:uncharacterized protein LOC144167361 [Haemaphysalis longicornis]